MPARMVGDEDDVLLEIDRILAGEDEELEAAEEESEDDAGEEVADEDDDGGEPEADFDFDDVVVEADDAGDAPATTSAPDRIGRTELVAILLSRKTKLHFMALVALLATFLLLSRFSSGTDLLLMLGYGGTLGYLLTGALTRLEAVRELSRSEHPTSLALPLVLGTLCAGAIFWGLRNPEWGDSLRSTLGCVRSRGAVGVGGGLVVVEGVAGATVAVPLGGPLHVSSIDWRLDSSDAVTVRLHRTLMSTHVSAYWHQYAESDGFHTSGPREPLERLAEAVTAMRC